MRLFLLIALALGWLTVTAADAQTTLPAHTVFLLGNTAQGRLPATRLRQLRRVLEQQATPFTVVHLGDIVANEGLASKQDTALSAQARGRADTLLALVRGLPLGRICFVPGDKDWANSGREGLKAVRRLEKYIEKQLPGQNAFVPTGGCPGPEVVDVAPLVRLVALNTPWFTHPYDKPEAPDTDCKTLTKEEFREQLQDIIDDTKGRNLLLLGHHPVVTNGVYGGREPLSRHLLPPVLGTVYAAYRQNVGTPRDLANPRYQELRKELLSNALRGNPGVVYAAAHDYSLQLTPFQGSYHLVVGSFVRSEHVGANAESLVNTSEAGYAALDYYADGTVKSRFFIFAADDQPARPAYAGTLFRSPCDADTASRLPVNSFIVRCPGAAPTPAGRRPDAPFRAVTTVVPGPEYAAGRTKRFFIGDIYRSSWLQPVQVKTLDLRTEKGGLRPFGRGGGRQTTSLKLLAADSAEYVFRSVDKDVTTILPPELRSSFVAPILKDITATANPYSGLPISALLDHTDVLHARPRLFRLPDNEQLGPYRPDYAGLLGTLEDRPTDPRPNRPGFGGADEVRRSYSFFRQLYKDHDNRVDAPALARARVFDMLVADFGKHEDNWKWAGYKQDNLELIGYLGPRKGTIYRPIPRDRDQAFTKWNGLLTYLANREWAVPSIEDFGEEFHDMKSLNWPARHLDRFLLQSLTRQDWQTAAHYLQTQLTPAVLDEATATLPPEVQPLSGQEINRRLKARLQQLPAAVDRYYQLLARRVDVVGSNKAEVFRIERLAGGRVRVREFDRQGDSPEPHGPALFDRTFEPSETAEICVYGLDGQDIFQVTGQGDRPGIVVRVIGGAGQDRITDDSRAPGLRRLTKVYDTPGTDLVAGPETDDRRAGRPDVNQYDREAFEFDGYAPRAGLFYNRNDGFGLSLGVGFVRQGFRKPDYQNRYDVGLQTSTGGQLQLTASTRHRYAIGKVDIGAAVSYGNFFPFYNYFGIGNDTRISQDLYDARYYRARYKGFTVSPFFERTFWQRSVLRVGPSYENYTADYASNSLLGRELNQALPPEYARPNADNQRLLGVNALFDLDLRNRRVFAQRGVRLLARHDSYRQLTGYEEFFGLSQASAEYLGTARLGIPVTLALKGGGAKAYGNSAHIPFYKLTSLGLAENLRGYYRNRFTGDASLYLNSELRLALGQSKNHFLPFYYGVFGFYDQGRVYYQGTSPGGWHAGYGGGFYLAPVVETLAFSVSYQVSPENSLVQFGLGFRIDK